MEHNCKQFYHNFSQQVTNLLSKSKKCSGLQESFGINVNINNKPETTGPNKFTEICKEALNLC